MTPMPRERTLIDESLLKAFWPTAMSGKEMSRRLNARTPSIYRRAKRLGLRSRRVAQREAVKAMFGEEQ